MSVYSADGLTSKETEMIKKLDESWEEKSLAELARETAEEARKAKIWTHRSMVMNAIAVLIAFIVLLIRILTIIL